MITSKFDYLPLTRIQTPTGRKYVGTDHKPVPSVTTILDATKPAEAKKALQEWRNRVGHKQAQAISTEAASRGTRMHKWLENYVKQGETGEPGTNPYSIQSHTMAQNIIQNGLTHCDEFWGTEVGLIFPDLYAGTTDLVGVHQGDDAIIDFKQTNKPKKREWITDYFIQLTAYAEAHNELYGTKIRKGVVLMCSADNQFQQFVIQGDEFDHYSGLWASRVLEYYSEHL
jgi:ATP-dependent exoDNAse (exonuclease V) beta subunit